LGDRNDLKRGNSALLMPSVSLTADSAGIERSLDPQHSWLISSKKLNDNPSDAKERPLQAKKDEMRKY